MTFTTGPSWRQSSGRGSPASVAVRSGSAFDRTAAAGSSRPPSSTTPRARPLVDDHALDRRLDVHAGAGRFGRRAQRGGHGAHPAARDSPTPPAAPAASPRSW